MGYSISGGFLTKTKAYSGRCHCGAVVDEVQADLAQVTSCNCSIFRKKGHLLSFVLAEAFVLRSGEDSLQDHRFNKKVIHHLFCRTCGIQSFARGTAPNGASTVALNLRRLDEADLDSITPVPFNGRDT